MKYMILLDGRPYQPFEGTPGAALDHTQEVSKTVKGQFTIIPYACAGGSCGRCATCKGLTEVPK